MAIFCWLFLSPYFFYPDILVRNLPLNKRFLSFPPNSVFEDLSGRQWVVGSPPTPRHWLDSVFHLHEVRRVVKFIETGSRTEVTRYWGNGERESLFNVYYLRVSVCGNSSQDVGIDRNASFPCTTKRRITTNLKTVKTRTARKSNCMELWQPRS